MVCSRWPEPRKNKNKQKKTKLQTTCPQSQTRAPMGSAVLFFCFFWFFEVFAWFAPDGQNLEKQKKQYNQNCRPHVHRVRQEPQWGLQFCFFCFFEVFAWFAPDGQNLEKTKKNKTADHMSTESDKSPNGVCSFVFFVFLSFSRFLHGLLQMARTSKKQNKTKNCRPHVHRVRQEPQWGLQFFVFFAFSRFLHGLLQMANSKGDCLFIL